jgi:hypothetical protein
MAYAIIRAQKIKSFQQAGACHSHNVRQELDKDGETIFRENVDYNKSGDNTHWQAIGENAVDGVKTRLAELDITPRSNAVLAIEYVVSASPEFFDENKNNYQTAAYFSEALKFIIQKHGYDNVVSSTIHMDEQTPHAHILVVPIDKQGKLNCREFLGGSEKLSKLQDDFHAAMKHTSRGIPLERGEKRGKGEPDKYIDRTSHILGRIRHDFTHVEGDIARAQKNAAEALKTLNLELAKIELERLEKATIKLAELKNNNEELKKAFHKTQDPQKKKGMGM